MKSLLNFLITLIIASPIFALLFFVIPAKIAIGVLCYMVVHVFVDRYITQSNLVQNAVNSIVDEHTATKSEAQTKAEDAKV